MGRTTLALSWTPNSGKQECSSFYLLLSRDAGAAWRSVHPSISVSASLLLCSVMEHLFHSSFYLLNLPWHVTALPHNDDPNIGYLPLATVALKHTWGHAASPQRLSEWGTSTLVSDRRYATHLPMPGKISSVTFRARCPAVVVRACQVRAGGSGFKLHHKAGGRRR